MSAREQNEGTDGVTGFIGRLGRLDKIALRLGIDDEIAYDERKSEILKRLKVSEHIPPRGIYADLTETDRLIDGCKGNVSYHDMLGKGVDVCTRIEHLLNLLVSFYGGVCFEAVFSNYLAWASRAKWRDEPQPLKKSALMMLCHPIGDKALKSLIYEFLRRDCHVELGPMINILQALNGYSAETAEFERHFHRDSIFSPREDEMKTVLKEIRQLRNPLPHNKMDRPEVESLQEPAGLRLHLIKLFEAVNRFKYRAEVLNLFPKAGLLIEKFDRLNRGLQIELFLETKERVYLACDDFSDLVIGGEYFFWQHPGRRDYVLLIKRFSQEVKYVTPNSSYIVPR